MICFVFMVLMGILVEFIDFLKIECDGIDEGILGLD